MEREEDITLLAEYFYKKIITQVESQTSVNVSDGELDPGASNGAVSLELIHPNDVIKALRQFIENNQEPLKLVCILTFVKFLLIFYWIVLSFVLNKISCRIFEILWEIIAWSQRKQFITQNISKDC